MNMNMGMNNMNMNQGMLNMNQIYMQISQLMAQAMININQIMTNMNQLMTNMNQMNQLISSMNRAQPSTELNNMNLMLSKMNLLFEPKFNTFVVFNNITLDKRFVINCNTKEKIKDIIEKYRIKSGDTKSSKFLYNNRDLNLEKTIEELEILEGAVIQVL